MGHTPESMDSDTTVMLPDTVTTSARDLPMLIPKLKLNHGWLMLTTDMLDTHTLPPMLMLLTHTPESMDSDTMVMLPDTVTTSARDLLMLIPKLKLNHGWLMLTTDMLDTHTLPPMALLTHT